MADGGYTRLEKLGEGTYGVVYKCRHNPTGLIVAMKKIRLDDEEEGVPTTAIREVSVLRELSILAEQGDDKAGPGSENIVKLLDVVHAERSKLALVFEYVDCDLKQYQDMHAQQLRRLAYEARGLPLKRDEEGRLPAIDPEHGKSDRALQPDLVKSLTRQLVLGLCFLHSKRIMHRDLKPHNLLIDKQHNLKIADFGLARAFQIPLRTYTHEIVTLWYRAPEVLLGARHYATTVDIWSVACIMAEMATGIPLLCGDSEIDQLFKICRLLGTPNEEQWPGVDTMPEYQPIFPKWRPTDLIEHLPQIPLAGVDLLARMLVFDPTRRISAKAALLHPYFRPTSNASSLTVPTTPVSICSLTRSSSEAMSVSTAPSSPLGPPSSPCSGLMASPM